MKRFWIKFGLVAGGWTALALILAANKYVRLLSSGTPSPFGRLLRWPLLDYWIWAALTPLVFAFAARVRFTRKHLAWIVAAHAGACIALSVVHVGIAAAIGIPSAASAKGSWLAVWRARFLLEFYSDIWMYVPLVFLWNLLDYEKRYRQREQQALQLESQLAKAQLEVLRSQLQPHFLFNTLNSISALMQEDAEAAEDMLADLSYMLRASLRGNTTQEITLAREIQLLEAYARIQCRRFEDRLTFEVDTPVETLVCLVPSLLLQPIVENAVQHGIAPLSRPGKIVVTSRRDGAHLVLTVADDGRGLPPQHEERIGLTNTRKRLEQLYGARQSLDLRSTPGQGVVATISLPWRFADEHPEGIEDEDSYRDRGRRTAGQTAGSLPAGD